MHKHFLHDFAFWHVYRDHFWPQIQYLNEHCIKHKKPHFVPYYYALPMEIPFPISAGMYKDIFFFLLV